MKILKDVTIPCQFLTCEYESYNEYYFHSEELQEQGFEELDKYNDSNGKLIVKYKKYIE